MNFYRNIFFIYFLLVLMSTGPVSAADDDEQLLKTEEEELPLNNPFDGTTGSNATSQSASGNAGAELENPMSLYNFKLSGLISGKDHSYISVVNSAGEAITLTLGQFLGKNKFIDLRLTEAIFKKEDGKYLILDFNNQIREADEY